MTFKTNLDELGHHDEIGGRPASTTSHDGEIGNEPGQMTSQDARIGNGPVPTTSQDEQVGDEPDGGSLPPDTPMDLPTNSTAPLMEDYWVKDGRLWVRFHVLPRTTKYVPQAGPGATSLDQLADRRDTYVVKPDDPLVDKQTDHWRTDNANQEIPYEWTGRTVFYESQLFPSEMSVDDMTTTEAVPAQGLLNR